MTLFCLLMLMRLAPAHPSPVPTTTTTTTTTTPAPPPTTTTTTAPPANDCATALAYLAANEAPGFTAYCPHDANGNAAVTTYLSCSTTCTDGVIYIANPCPAAYMNEAHNSWVFYEANAAGNVWGFDQSQIDPYGACPPVPYGSIP